MSLRRSKRLRLTAAVEDVVEAASLEADDSVTQKQFVKNLGGLRESFDASINNVVQAIRSSNENFDAKIDALDQRVAGVDSNITSMKSDITAEALVEAASQAGSTAQKRLAEKLDALKTSFDDNTKNLDAKIDALSQHVTTVKSEITTMKGEIISAVKSLLEAERTGASPGNGAAEAPAAEAEKEEVKPLPPTKDDETKEGDVPPTKAAPGKTKERELDPAKNDSETKKAMLRLLGEVAELRNALGAERASSASKLAEVEGKLEEATKSNALLTNQVIALQNDGRDLSKLLAEPEVALSDAKSTISSLSEANSQLSEQAMRCGNGICEAGEEALSCLADCPPRFLTTTFKGGHWTNSNVFEVKAVQDLFIIGFCIHTFGTLTGTAEVWERAGGYSGFENDQAGWTLAQRTVTGLGLGLKTELADLPEPVSIAAGSTHSFHIWCSSGLRCTYGSREGTVFAQNAGELIFFEGGACDGRFSCPIAPWVANIDIKYELAAAAAPGPTGLPVPSPTDAPSERGNLTAKLSDGNGKASLSCLADCPPRVLTTTFAGGYKSEGNVFKVQAVQDLLIIGFYIHTLHTSSGTAEVRERAGDYLGFENNRAGWTRAQSTAVVGLDPGSKTELADLPAPISIAAGATHSFHIWHSPGVRSTYSSGEGSVFSQDLGELIFFEGRACAGRFSCRYAPVVANLDIKYKLVAAAAPGPTS